MKEIGKCDPYSGVKVVIETDPKMTQMLGSVDKDFKIYSKNMSKKLKIYSHSDKMGNLSREMEPNENPVIKNAI